MDLIHTFAPSEKSTRRAAAATLQLSQLPGIPVHLAVTNLGCNGRNVVTAIVQACVDGIVIERICQTARWQGPAEPDCERELQALLMDPAFVTKVLEPVAQDIAGMAGRTFVTQSQAAQRAQAWTAHRFPTLGR